MSASRESVDCIGIGTIVYQQVEPFNLMLQTNELLRPFQGELGSALHTFEALRILGNNGCYLQALIYIPKDTASKTDSVQSYPGSAAPKTTHYGMTMRSKVLGGREVARRSNIRINKMFCSPCASGTQQGHLLPVPLCFELLLVARWSRLPLHSLKPSNGVRGDGAC
eukprot:624296-Amphidinium_carterae.2